MKPWLLLPLLASLSLPLTGCQTNLETDYAAPNGSSINGISSWLHLLRARGHQVRVARALSARLLTNLEVLVVFHDDLGEMPYETCAILHSHLEEGTLRKLLIIPRDSDAQIDYWRSIAARTNDTSLADRTAAQSEAMMAQSRLEMGPVFSVDANEYSFYGYERASRGGGERIAVAIKTSAGGDFDSTISAKWPLSRRLLPNEWAETLWSSGENQLLVAEGFESQSVYVLASAAPLLNGGLVDPGNRQLAERVADLLGKNETILVTTSSRWREGEESQSPSFWRFLTVNPLPWVVGHVLLALMLFCWCKFPIFGRPRTESSRDLKRFGRHVEAFGELLQRSRNMNFSMRRIRDWQRPQVRHVENSDLSE